MLSSNIQTTKNTLHSGLGAVQRTNEAWWPGRYIDNPTIQGSVLP